MKMSHHDSVMLAITVFVILFGAVASGVRKQVGIIRDNTRAVQRLNERISYQRELIAARSIWEERYNSVKDLMPVFNPSAQVGTFWMSKMDAAAQKRNIRIIQRTVREESVVAGVSELPLEVRQWEGTLEALVNYIHDLEAAGAMLEIRELRISPIPNRQGYLKGSFLLYCAFLRAEGGTADATLLDTSAADAAEESESDPEEASSADDAEEPAAL